MWKTGFPTFTHSATAETSCLSCFLSFSFLPVRGLVLLFGCWVVLVGLAMGFTGVLRVRQLFLVGYGKAVEILPILGHPIQLPIPRGCELVHFATLASPWALGSVRVTVV